MTKKPAKIPTFEEYCAQALCRLQTSIIEDDPNRLPEIECAKWIIERYRTDLRIHANAIDPRMYAKENLIGNYLLKMLDEEQRETFSLQLLAIATILEIDVFELWVDSEFQGKLVSYFRCNIFKSRIN